MSGDWPGDYARIDIIRSESSLRWQVAQILSLYRNEHAFNEAVTNRILMTSESVRAVRGVVTAQFSARGIALTVRASIRPTHWSRWLMKGAVVL
jgi:hypothetical protein